MSRELVLDTETTGLDFEDGHRLVEIGIIELENHPWFIGVQFHPEFKSRPLAPHPLFSSFIKAAKIKSNK